MSTSNRTGEGQPSAREKPRRPRTRRTAGTAASKPARNTSAGLRVPVGLDGKSPLNAALAYAKNGFYIAPVRPDTKSPGSILGNDWQEQTSRDPEQIRRWWKQRPDAAIALHVGRSGCFVFDFDAGSLDDLPEPFRSALAKAATQLTRTDGSDRGHYVFRTRRGEEFGNSAPKAFAPFGEVRGKNGVIIAQPSVHIEGGEYRWRAPGVVRLLPKEIAAELKKAADYAPAATDAEVESFLDEHLTNDRPHALDGVVENLRRDLDDGRRSSRHEAFTSALAWAFEEARAGCYPAREAAARLAALHREAYSGPGRTPSPTEWPGMCRWAVAQAQKSDPAAVLAKVNRSVDDSEFWTARQSLMDLRAFARARRVSPWSMLGVTLARAVASAPPNLVLPAIIGGQASLNLFVALVAPSGSGKGTAERASRAFLDVHPPVDTDTVGSGEGVAKLYAYKYKGEQVNTRNQVLFSVAEVDTFTALGQRQGATLLPELRKAWSGEQLGFGYSDPTKKVKIAEHRYRMALTLGVQPGRAGPLFDDADGGTPQRFLWFPTLDADAPDLAPQEPEPRVLTCGYGETAAEHASAVERLHVEPTRGELHDIAVPDSAISLIQEEQLAKLRGRVGSELDGHALLARLKAAAALMLLDGRFDKITDEDWGLSETVMAVSAQTRTEVGRALGDRARRENERRGRAEGTRQIAAAEVAEEDRVKRVAQNLLRSLAKASPQSRRVLSKSLNSRDRHHFDAAIERLLDAGSVSEEGGRYAAT